MSRRLNRLLPIGLILTLGLAACSRGMSDLEDYVTEVKARKTRQIEPIPQIKQYEAFVYKSEDHRDPFVGAEPARDANSPSSLLRPDLTRNREPLEEFPLDSLRMLGIIGKDKMNYALVKAPDNVVHRVTVGNHLGQNYGKIIKVTETLVELVEIIPDGFGGFMERPASLALTE